ncbi:MAG: hypothetical protein AABM29_00045 [Actinomycetota bacterium]
MAFDLDTYSQRAERFVSELDREYHLHYSGQKPDYRVERVYERHAELFARDAVDRLREASGGRAGAGGERARRARLLLELAFGGHLGMASAAEEAAIAEREAELEIELDGERIGYRMAAVIQANEPDPERRQRLEAARLGLLEEYLNPLHLTALRRSHELVRELGWPSYAAACTEVRGIDLEALAGQTARFVEDTDPVYERIMEPELERVLGIRLAAMRRSDLSRFFRAPGLDAAFPAERLIESFARTVAGMGLDLESQTNIVLDTEQRPTKTARAYCAPVRVPQEVYLVVPRVGGREDFAALFHEGGHAEHYANVASELPPEYRYLGDNSVTESYAFLLEHLTEDPAWLRELLGAEEGEVVSHARAVKLYFLRRYAAKIAYELELHGEQPDLDSMPGRYAELLGEATRVEWTPQTWLDDVDSGFYVAGYLRAWALETRWRAHLRRRFGESWFAQPAAGDWLVGLWRQGQRLRADELVAETLGEELDFGVLAAEFA